MKKNALFFIVLSIGLMVPAGLESSNRDSAWQGLASMYRSMPSISQYLPSFSQWLTNLSENQQRKLFIALGAMLGIPSVYKLYSYRQSLKEDQAKREAAIRSLEAQGEKKSEVRAIPDIKGFKKANRDDYDAPENLQNLAEYFYRRDNHTWDKIKTTKKDVFDRYIYPVLATNYMQNNNPNSWINLIQKTRNQFDFLKSELVKDRDLLGQLKTDLQEYRSLNVNAPSEFTEPRFIFESMDENLKRISFPGFGPRK